MRVAKYIVATLFAILVILFTPAHSEPKLIFQQDNLQVVEIRNFRCIRFTNSKLHQSCMDVTAPDKIMHKYLQVMVNIFAEADTPVKKVLIVGLGGGTLATALENNTPGLEVDVVELNRDMLALAKKYFGFKPSSATKVYLEDGHKFIMESNANTYDYIFLDAFDETYIPKPFLEPAFIDQVRNILKPDGFVVVNSFKDSTYDEKTLYENTFGDIRIEDAGNNEVIIAQKNIG